MNGDGSNRRPLKECVQVDAANYEAIRVAILADRPEVPRSRFFSFFFPDEKQGHVPRCELAPW